ncbi:MAG: hypothetical protein ABSH14_12715 [Verrucomicrobiia bacterium]
MFATLIRMASWVQTRTDSTADCCEPVETLGHPPRKSTKFFATETLEQLRRDVQLLPRLHQLKADHPAWAIDGCGRT